MPAQEIIPADIATETTLQDVAELLQEVAIRLSGLGTHVLNTAADGAGRLRVALEAGSATGATLGAVQTVINQQQLGSYWTNQHMICLTLMAEGELRRNIVIS